MGDREDSGGDLPRWSRESRISRISRMSLKSDMNLKHMRNKSGVKTEVNTKYVKARITI